MREREGGIYDEQKEKKIHIKMSGDGSNSQEVERTMEKGGTRTQRVGEFWVTREVCEVMTAAFLQPPRENQTQRAT